MRRVRVVALAGVMLAWALRGFAQQSVDYASIGGRVLDPSGATVAAAQVSARHIEDGRALAGAFEVREKGAGDPIAVGGIALPAIGLATWLWALRNLAPQPAA